MNGLLNGTFDVDDDDEPCSIADDNGTDDNGRGVDMFTSLQLSSTVFKGTLKKLYNADQADKGSFYCVFSL